MDFLQQLDQLSDDYYEDQPGLNYQGIKSVSVDNSYDNVTINDQFTEENISSNITYHSNDSNSTISTSVLSDKGRSIFCFQNFNKMQSKSFAHLYENDFNCVISSPTGSGKTVLFELSILRLLNNYKDTQNIKILYIAPTKALCLEREKDWISKFSSFGLSVGVLTSDTSYLETDKVKQANIIITTPEKWDLMTRKWTDYTKLFEMIKILLIDEIHILKENRGSTLEVVVTRMKKICQNIRIIALSATVPNIQDISKWIKLNSKSPMNAVTLVFGEEFRPIALKKIVYGYKQNANDFMFDSFLNSKLIKILNEQNLNNKPVMIFCPTRNSTISTSKFLMKNYNGLRNLNKLTNSIKEKDLSEMAKLGFAYHHAGLSLGDRNSVENSFKNGSIKILCSTSTLAVGINLPAYLVIIKGTKMWNNISFEEYSELDILQMMGRAGRPQFETEGKAVIMTNSEKQQHYESLIKGNKKLESKLHLNLYENLTSEIFLNTITSLQDALTWLKHTFFYSRYNSNPAAYNEIPYLPNADMDGRLMHYCESKLRELIDFNIIEINNGCYKSTVYGDAMTKHYIMFETMKMFIKCPKKQSISDLLLIISKSKEFQNIRLKRTEKKLFKVLNDLPILKFPVKSNKKSVSIESSCEKIYLLIQYELSGIDYPNDPDLTKLQHSFKQDNFLVFKHVNRLLKCLIDCFIEKKDFISLKSCLFLFRSVNSQGWEDSSASLRQLSSIGLAYIKKFENYNISSFKQIKELELSRLEYYLGLKPGQANKIKSQVESLPNLSIISEFIKYSKSRNNIMAKIKVTINVESKGNRWNGKNLTINVISGLSTGELINFRRAHISKIPGLRSFILDFPLIYKESIFESIISCEEIGGISQLSNLDLIEHLKDEDMNKLQNLKSTIILYILKSFNPTNSYKSEDISEIEDDDDFDELLIEASNKKKPETDSRVVGNGDLRCKQTSKDKTKYGNTRVESIYLYPVRVLTDLQMPSFTL